MAKRVSAKAKAAKRAGAGQALPGFSSLEKKILLAKGLSPDQLARLTDCGILGRDSFKQVGDSATLSEVTGIPLEVAEKVMSWALGFPRAVARTATTLEELIEAGEYIPWEDLHVRE